MKYLLFFLLATNVATSQQLFIETSTDIKMAAKGPYAEYDPSLDLMTSLGVEFDRFKYSIYVEDFLSINYLGYGAEVRYKIRRKRLGVEFGVDIGVVVRDIKYVSSSFSPATSGQITYELSNSFSLVYKAVYRYRGDLVRIYNDSNPMRLSTFLGAKINIFKNKSRNSCIDY